MDAGRGVRAGPKNKTEMTLARPKADPKDEIAAAIRAASEARKKEVERLIGLMTLNEKERGILDGFHRVFNRRRRQREARKQAVRVASQLFRERLDDEREKLGQLGPTPETRRKLRADVILRLFAQGKLGRPEVTAAERIREARAAVARALYPARVMEPQTTRVKGLWTGKSGIERLSDRELVLWTQYIGWAVGMTGQPFGKSEVTKLEIVLDVIEENLGPSQIERLYGLPEAKGGVTRILADALFEYVFTNGLALNKKKYSP